MEEKKAFFNSFKKIIYFIFLLGSFFIVSQTFAATLYLSPSSGSKPVGKNFTVSVYVSSADQAMNAASGNIDIDTSKLEVISISKSGSIFSLWAQEPSFTAGSVSFEGIVLNPGYKGSSGKIITFTVRPKEAGAASVRFSSGSVLANDGSGTNIVSGLGSANFILTGASPVSETPESTVVEASGVPGTPKVTSVNCPGPEGWCTSNDPKFTWGLPAGTTGVSILGDHNPATNPGTRSDGLMSSYTYTDVEEGDWYFHIRLRNAAGWGATAHYQFQVDTQKPESFDLSLLEPINPLDPVAKLFVSAKDSGSGISKYEIKIDNNETQTWVDDGRHIFQTSPLGPGKHTVVAKAIDKAGNYLTDSLEIIVNSIEPPKITDYPEELVVGQVLIIKGQSYNNVQVTFFIQKEGSEPVTQSVKADSDGNFKLAFVGKLTEGVYAVWAEAENDKGAKSNPSDRLTIIISQRAVLRIGSLIVSYLSVVISLLVLTVGLGALVGYIWRQQVLLKRKVKEDVETVEKTVHTAFDELRESTRKQVSTLEKVRLKRELTKEEAKILVQLKNQLNAAESFINKEVEKIEKRLR